MGVGVADAVIKQGQGTLKVGHRRYRCYGRVGTDATDGRSGGGAFIDALF